MLRNKDKIERINFNFGATIFFKESGRAPVVKPLAVIKKTSVKTTILLTILSIYSCAVAQDTTYYGKNGVVINDKSFALVYRILVKDKIDTNKVNEKYYYPNDNIQSEYNYSNFTEEILHGQNKDWYETGELKEVVNYYDGYIVGYRTTYWKNGIIKRKDKYVNGKFKKGEVWDSIGRKEKYYSYYQDAQFNEEIGSLRNYFINNLQYPQKAIENKIEGKVKVSFVVDLDGSIIDVEIMEGVSEELDKEAIRLIQGMPKWIPAKWDGNPNRQRLSIPINFTL